MTRKSEINSDRKNKLKQYLKYSNLAFQMIAIIMIGVLGGIKLDEVIVKIEFPVFTFTLSILGIVAAVYFAIKDFIKK